MDNLNSIGQGFMQKRNTLRQGMDQRRTAVGDRLRQIMANRPQAPARPVMSMQRPQAPQTPVVNQQVYPRPEMPPMNTGQLMQPRPNNVPTIPLNNMRGTDIVNAILKLRRQNATFRG